MCVASSDYAPGPHIIEFAPGATEVNKSVNIVNDNLVEDTEFFLWNLTISPALVAIGLQVDPCVARVNITDNDGMPAWWVQVP